MTIRLLSMLTLGLLACGTPAPADPDSPVATPGDTAQVGLPSWILEDIQPASPRVGQTYGLQTFSDKIVVVTLLEGF